jgi:hypothetical protein
LSSTTEFQPIRQLGIGIGKNEVVLAATLPEDIKAPLSGFKHGFGAQKLLHKRAILRPREECSSGAGIPFYQKAAEFPSAGWVRLIGLSQIERVIFAAESDCPAPPSQPNSLSDLNNLGGSRDSSTSRRCPVIDAVSPPESPLGSLLPHFVTSVTFCSSPLCTDHRLLRFFRQSV